MTLRIKHKTACVLALALTLTWGDTVRAEPTASESQFRNPIEWLLSDIGGDSFDGETETAIFPGDLPDNPDSIFEEPPTPDAANRFVRFRPPRLERAADGTTLSLPHIRLDKALQFLIGDRVS